MITKGEYLEALHIVRLYELQQSNSDSNQNNVLPPPPLPIPPRIIKEGKQPTKTK